MEKKWIMFFEILHSICTHTARHESCQWKGFQALGVGTNVPQKLTVE